MEQVIKFRSCEEYLHNKVLEEKNYISIRQRVIPAWKVQERNGAGQSINMQIKNRAYPIYKIKKLSIEGHLYLTKKMEE